MFFRILPGIPLEILWEMDSWRISYGISDRNPRRIPDRICGGILGGIFGITPGEISGEIVGRILIRICRFLMPGGIYDGLWRNS